MDVMIFEQHTLSRSMGGQWKSSSLIIIKSLESILKIKRGTNL
jgi:hypothetical protein